jgi:NTE family protein
MNRSGRRSTLRWRRRLPVFKLALQGGGAHGAFTWGVLERLLEEPDFRFDAISGTSAGAMNAVVLADGWRRGGAEGARDALASFWHSVAGLTRMAPVRPGDLPQFALDLTAQLLSPYQLNPFGLNPLRDVIERLVDFPALQEDKESRVVVAATVVETGEPVLFDGQRLTVDAVLASACLPQLYHAIEIDGRAYWDGGYACNPPLRALAAMSGSRHLLLVQINPLAKAGAPRSSAAIRNRVGEIVFGRALQNELDELARHRSRHRWLRVIEPRPEKRRLARHVLWRLDGAPELGQLDPTTKLAADFVNLDGLRERGRAAAQAWLERAFGRNSAPQGATRRFRKSAIDAAA